jgi:aerobic carbon-monoxide dehydrogenase small subunit
MAPAIQLTMTINGDERTFLTPINWSLLDLLRSEGYMEVKNGCLNGDCGSCCVELNGRPVNGCLVMAAHCEGATILTAAGLGRADALHPLQQAMLDHSAAQCGFCIPGVLIAAKHLIDHNPEPSRDEIREGLAGNLCRCTGYVKIIDAVEDAAGRMRKGKKKK